VRDLTLCLPYYINAGMLAAQYAALAALRPETKAHLRLIVVDDASPSSPAAPPQADIGVPVEIYRITVDVPWNQDAARNLAADRARTEWLILTDIDHVLHEKTAARLVAEDLQPYAVYRFGRRLDAPDLAPKIKNGHHHPHPNSWVMTRAMYDRVGGYDEALAGNYGTDGDFARRVAQVAPVLTLKWPLIRYPREVIADASTTTLARKDEAQKARIRELIHARPKKGWTPLRGSFPWEQVF
jgi:hypothetical protein